MIGDWAGRDRPRYSGASMNFDLDPRHAPALARADALCREVLPGLATDADHFFQDASRALDARDLFSDGSIEAAARVAMRLGAASGSLASVFASGFGFARARRLTTARSNAAGHEPPVGVLALRGTLTLATDGQTSKLQGDAPFVPGAPVATDAVVVVGSSAIACVELAAPGVSRSSRAGTLGFDRVPVCALRFDDVALDAASLVAVGDAAVAAIRVLCNVQRILHAAIAIGIGRRAFDIGVNELRARGSRPSQSTEFSLSDVATDLDAAELSLLRAAWALDRHAPGSLEAASAALLATRAGTRAAHTALVLVGESSCTGDLRECYLEACALEFHHETSAEQVATIASEVLEES
jgi:alkylation response protein AidB-like acyl-CoA dehydrogenase